MAMQIVIIILGILIKFVCYQIKTTSFYILNTFRGKCLLTHTHTLRRVSLEFLTKRFALDIYRYS